MMGQSDDWLDQIRDRHLRERQRVMGLAFRKLSARERQLLTCALAGNFPDHLNDLRPAAIKALAWADMPGHGSESDD